MGFTLVKEIWVGAGLELGLGFGLGLELGAGLGLALGAGLGLALGAGLGLALGVGLGLTLGVGLGLELGVGLGVASERADGAVKEPEGIWAGWAGVVAWASANVVVGTLVSVSWSRGAAGNANPAGAACKNARLTAVKMATTFRTLNILIVFMSSSGVFAIQIPKYANSPSLQKVIYKIKNVKRNY